MRKLFTTLSLLLTSMVLYAQDNEDYRYRKFYTNLRQYTSMPDSHGGMNIGYQSIRPLKLKGRNFQNIKVGLDFNFQITGDADHKDQIPIKDMINLRLGFVTGYNYALSEQLSVFGSLKPSLGYTYIEPNSDKEEPKSNFDFLGLIGLEGRYFFTKTSKHGIATEIFTSFEGGYGFTVGYTWRK